MQVGRLAPDFELTCTAIPGQPARRVCLRDYRGRWVAILFYPRDFSLVCPTELTNIGAHLSSFEALGCDLLGVSCDTLETHQRWLRTPFDRGGVAGLGFPLASDSEAQMARSYNVYVEGQGVALRGLFLIDPNGVLQYEVVHNLSVGRSADEVLRVLSALQTGGLCASDWTPGEPTIDPTEALGSGSMLSHYRIDEEVGSGSFATVYRATDITLQRTVALKVLKPGTPTNASTVLAEARSMAALAHPNVCTIFGVDDTEGVPLIAMEYVEGQPLSRLIEHEPLDSKTAAWIIHQVSSGVSAAHDAGIVHGDLKPENVLVDPRYFVKVLDFGLARQDRRKELDPHAETLVLGMAEVAGIYGTPGYMSPEMTRGGKATFASDVFALGTILFETLTGRKAFPGDNVLHVFDCIRDVQPEHLASQLPEPFAEIVKAALAPDPLARTLSMREIALRLQRAAR